VASLGVLKTPFSCQVECYSTNSQVGNSVLVTFLYSSTLPVQKVQTSQTPKPRRLTDFQVPLPMPVIVPGSGAVLRTSLFTCSGISTQQKGMLTRPRTSLWVARAV